MKTGLSVVFPARVNRRVVRALGLLVPLTLLGQSPAVYSVFPQPLSPGVRATLSVVGIGREATVRVGGRPAVVLGYGYEEPVGAWLDVQIPVDLTPGPAALEVTSGGVSAEPFPVTIDPFSPELYRLPVDCSPGGTLKPGDRGVLYAIGLGATNPVVATGVAAPASPLAHTLVMPGVAFQGQPVEVFESVLAPGEVGIYRVTFKVPAAQGFQRLELGIGGKISSGTPSVPVGNTLSHGSASSLPPVSREGPAAPDSILSAYPCGAPFVSGAEVYVGDARNPAAALAGITVRVKDSRGAERPAPILYASSRVDYIVPSGTAEGFATVTLTRPDGAVSTGSLYIRPVMPRLFRGFASAPAAIVVRARGGVTSVEQVIETTPPYWVPIDLGPETDEVFLVLFGTGLRHRRSLEDLKVVFSKHGNSPLFSQVQGVLEYAGAQGEFAGVDQLNVRLPRSLAGSGFQMLLLVTAEQMSKWPPTGPTGPESEGWTLFFK
jgi:uncharacterized protein (TIGR03437 family)